MLKIDGQELIKKLMIETPELIALTAKCKQLHEKWINHLRVWDNPYAKALIMDGYDGKPWPSPDNPYIPELALIEIFDEVLGGSTLNNLNSIIYRNMRGKLNKEAVTSKIKQSTFYQKFLNQTAASIQSKQEIIESFEKKAASAVMTEEECEFSKILDFDHYYSYSDDGQVCRNGAARHDQVKATVKEKLKENPHLLKVVEVVAKYYNLQPQFFM
jgi:hypothetical protein